MNFILQILKLFAMMVFVRLSTLNALKVNITRMLTNEVLIKSDQERENNTKESRKKALTAEKDLNKLDNTQNIIEEKKTVTTHQIHQTELVSPKNCFKISSNSPEKINLKKNKSQLYISKLDIRNNSSLQIIVNDNKNIFSPTSLGQHNNSQLCISNLDLSNNSTFQVIINNNDAGYFQIVFKILKDYCRCVQEIVFKILDESIHIGIYLKQSLYTVWDASKCYLSDNAVKDPCKIGKEYGDELSELLAKIVNIESAAKKIDQISVDIKQIKENFSQIINIKSDIDDFKSEMLSFLNISSTPNISFVSPLKRPPPPIPPPPPPMPSLLPPPPPPPLPPTSLLTNSNIPIKIKKTNGQKKDKSLPVISLEDILSVKLKKTSKRRTQSSNDRPLDPTVPIEILKQVKLKPTKLEFEAQESPFLDETSTNQHSSLQKILKDEISTGEKLTNEENGTINFLD